jgi:hypothetical protein
MPYLYMMDWLIGWLMQYHACMLRASKDIAAASSPQAAEATARDLQQLSDKNQALQDENQALRDALALLGSSCMPDVQDTGKEPLFATRHTICFPFKTNPVHWR